MKEKIRINVNVDTSKTLKRLQREEKVQAMREGRRQRATVFADKRKQASKKACRGKVQW